MKSEFYTQDNSGWCQTIVCVSKGRTVNGFVSLQSTLSDFLRNLH